VDWRRVASGRSAPLKAGEPTMSDRYDVIVIGGGPMGLASAYHCAKAGKSVLLSEQFNFFNQSGSSNDLGEFRNFKVSRNSGTTVPR
jgi:thioredoxin reductase